MKVLFYHLTPFAFAHGGLQIQILQTRKALEALGVEVEFLRWWTQIRLVISCTFSGDFGLPSCNSPGELA